MRTIYNHPKAWLCLLLIFLGTCLNAQIAVTPTVTHMDCGQSNAGAISLSVSGGTSPYAYKWSTTATTSSISGLASGIYTATVYDNAGDSLVKSVALGYKTVWDELVKYEEDSLGGIVAVHPNGLYDNYAFGLNTLPPNTDGWLEYLIAAGDTVQGSLDLGSNMNRDQTSYGYGFYIYGSYVLIQSYAVPGTPFLGTYAKGSAYRLRLQVAGDSISFIQMNGSGTVLAKQTFPYLGKGGSAGVLGMVHGNRVAATYSSFDCSVIRITFNTSPVADVHTAGNIIANVRGGTSPYSYLWSNAATTKDLNNIGVGDYTLVVTDDNSATVSNTAFLGAYVTWDTLINITENPDRSLVSTAGSVAEDYYPDAYGFGLNTIPEDTTGILLFEFDRAAQFGGIVGWVAMDTNIGLPVGVGLVVLPNAVGGDYEDDGLYFLQPYDDPAFLGNITDSVPLNLKFYKDGDSLKVVKNGVVTMSFYHEFHGPASPVLTPFFTGAKLTRATCSFVTSRPLPPTVPGEPVLTLCTSDTSNNFVIGPVRVGSGGNATIWSRDSLFAISDTIGVLDTISLAISLGQRDSIWLRSINSADGTIGKAKKVYFQAKEVKERAVLLSDSVIDQDSSVYVIVDSSQPGIKYYLEVGDLYMDSLYGNGDSILLNARNLKSSGSYRVLGMDTSGHCNVQVDEDAEIVVAVPECYGVGPDTSLLMASLQSCDNASNDFDYYRQMSNWIPDEQTAIKYVNVRFVALSKSGDPSLNFECNSATENFLIDLVDDMNIIMANLSSPTDPYASVCGSDCYIQDSRIRFVYQGLSCVTDPDENVFIPIVNERDAITIHLLDDRTSSDGQYRIGGQVWQGVMNFPSTIGFSLVNRALLPTYATMRNYHWGYANGIYQGVLKNLIHELGHALGLHHVYDSEPCDINHPEYLSDVFGPTQGTCYEPYNNDDPSGNMGCDPNAALNDKCTNNFMGWRGYYLSPLQLGRIHRNTMLSNLSLYACGNNDKTYYVTESETWDFDIKFFGDIVVESDVSLTIRCRVNMAPGARIIVKAGGKLFVDGGLITNAPSRDCVEQWGGIVMEGLMDQAQLFTTADNETAMSNQPFVFLRDATIENAYEAIRVWKTSDGWVDAFGSTNKGGTGGVVRAVNTTFRNNKRSAEFMWYRNVNEYNVEKANQSYFYNCEFITDNDHLDDHPFHAHVTAWGVKDIPFVGCRFINDRTINSSVADAQLGAGIRTIDAGILITDYNQSYGGETNNLVRSEFKNLQYGVQIMDGGAALHGNKVFHAEFENCIRGIHNEGVNLAKFIGNNFTIGGNDASVYINGQAVFLPNEEGIILRQATGFSVEQNEFELSGTPNTSHISLGLRADGTGQMNNVVYKNSFDGMHFANVAARDNQNNDIVIPKGLTYECNSQSNTVFRDITVTAPLPGDVNTPFNGISIRQGGISLSAGNTFSHDDTYLPESDLGNFAVGLNYYHNGDQLASNPVHPYYKTTNVNTNFTNIPVNGCNNNYVIPSVENPTSGGCSTCLTIGGYASAFSSHKAAYNAYAPLYAALIDGGNTNTLLAYIDTISNADSLLNRLSAYAPNLSAQVLDRVAKRNAIDTSYKYQIIKANAEGLRHETMDYLESRLHLPQWMLDSINAARALLSYRSYLQDTVLQHAIGKEQAAYGALSAIQEDTAGLDLTLYRQWLDSLGNGWSRYQMLKTYLHEGRLDTLPALLIAYDNTIVKSISDSIAYSNFKDYMLHYADWIAADSAIMHLDSTNLVQLAADAESNEYLKGSQMARNILNFFYDSLYFTPVTLPDEISAKKEAGAVERNEQPQAVIVPEPLTSLKLYPNPAKNRITIEYDALKQDTKLYITNMLGDVLEERALTAGSGKLELDTESYGNGVYLARLDGRLQKKFVILK